MEGDEDVLVRCLQRGCMIGDGGGVELEGAGAMASGPWNLYDLGDDALSYVLSFLSPVDIASCSRVSQRLRRLCRDEDKVSGGIRIFTLVVLDLL